MPKRRSGQKEVEHMAITRWDPFRDLLNLQNEMTRVFGRAYGEEGEGIRASWAPPIDIYETHEAYRVVAELPGFSPDQVDVTVNEGTLTIKGERKFYDEVNEENFHRVERRFGAFQRIVSLPQQVESDKVEASFDKGVLTVSIPKAERAKPHRVEIKAEA
jgi:HSP20 family protein